MEVLQAQYGFDPGNPAHTYDTMMEKYRAYLHIALSLSFRMREANLLGSMGHEEEDLQMTRILGSIVYSSMGLNAMFRMRNHMDPDFVINDDPALWRFTPIDTSELKAQEGLLFHLLTLAYSEGLRRYLGEFVYEQIRTESGQPTYAWKQRCTVEEFIFDSCKRHIHFDQWRSLVDNNPAKIVTLMQKCQDPEFPNLKKDRHIFSWTNGVYFIEEDKFYPYADPMLAAKPDVVACMYHPLEFDPYENLTGVYFGDRCPCLRKCKCASQCACNAKQVCQRTARCVAFQGDVESVMYACPCVTPAKVHCRCLGECSCAKEKSCQKRPACRHGCPCVTPAVVDCQCGAPRLCACAKNKECQRLYRCVVHEPDSIFNIPTPNFDRIMADQHWSYEVRLWNYVFFGRLLYWLEEKDNWQCMNYYRGLNNTGKSTFVKVAQMLYDDNDTGLFSNNQEKTFGWGALYDKLIIVAPEIKKNMNTDQAELQSAICGEGVSVKRKNKTAEKHRWRVPMIWAGNEVPDWDDTAGAMARRLVIFTHMFTIERVDGDLEKKIRGELAQLILKTNRAYHGATSQYAGKGIWEILPTPFQESKKQLQEDVSKIHEFFASEEVERVEGAYCPVKELRKAYNKFVTANHYNPRKHTWTKEGLYKVLRDMGLDPPSRSTKPYPRPGIHERQIVFVEESEGGSQSQGPNQNQGRRPKKQIMVFGLDLVQEFERTGERDSNATGIVNPTS
jgi:hypothetical protein